MDPRTFLHDDLDPGADEASGHVGDDRHPVLAGDAFR